MKYVFPWKRAVTRPSYSRIPSRPLKRGAHFIEIARRTSAPLSPRRTQACRNAAEITSARGLDSWLRAIKEKKKEKETPTGFPPIQPPPPPSSSSCRRHDLSPPSRPRFLAGTMPPRSSMLLFYMAPIPWDKKNLNEPVIRSWFFYEFWSLKFKVLRWYYESRIFLEHEEFFFVDPCVSWN